MLKYTALLLLIAQISIYAAEQNTKQINVIVYEHLPFCQPSDSRKLIPIYSESLHVGSDFTYEDVQRIIHDRIHRQTIKVGRDASKRGFIYDMSSQQQEKLNNLHAGWGGANLLRFPVYVTCDRYSMD